LSATDIRVRRLEAQGDAPLYRDIRLESLQLAPEAYGSAYDDELAQSLAWFAGRLQSSWVAGAFRGDALIGVAGHVVQEGPKRRHKGFLWGVYVRPAARRRGVARLLCEAVLAEARSKVEQVQLQVTATNLSAQRLYESLGFVAWGLEKQARIVGGRYYDDVHMTKGGMSH
jgi:ribosomal protein S18 acetylase RimI-like enzyme